MAHENFIIKIGDKGSEKEISDIYQFIISLEVEIDDELAGMFKLRMAIFQRHPDNRWNKWSALEDKRFTVWKSVILKAGFEGNKKEHLLTGYITHIKPQFDPEPTKCILEIWGIDESVLMNQEEKLKAWPNKNDSDIAKEIFGLYQLKFTPPSKGAKEVHDEKISTIIQRETDMQFLQRLALRNGFECYVEDGKGYFQPPSLDEKPQPVLAVHFGTETNVTRFSIEVNALTPANVAMYQVDRINKKVLDTIVETSKQKALGKTMANDLFIEARKGKIKKGKIYVGMNAATGEPEMKALCQGLFHQAEWFVTGEGEIAANKYKHVLKPRKTVTIKGIGKTHSGVYYVSHVTHSFTQQGYTQKFHVKRNGIQLTNQEKFS